MVGGRDGAGKNTHSMRLKLFRTTVVQKKIQATEVKAVKHHESEEPGMNFDESSFISGKYLPFYFNHCSKCTQSRWEPYCARGDQKAGVHGREPAFHPLADPNTRQAEMDTALLASLKKGKHKVDAPAAPKHK
jgi:hypothetical protein